MKQYREDSGVSPVIAVLLILAMTVAMAGVVGVVVFSMGNINGMPAAGILIDEKGGVITITHYAGDALKDGTYLIMVDDTDRTEEFRNAGPDDGYFGPGDILSWPISSGALRHVAVVYNGEKGSFMLAEKWFEGIAGDGGMSAAFTMSSTTGTLKSGMPVVLQATAADLTGGYPITVSFNPEEASADAEYLWTFGNGQMTNISSPTYIYESTGEYTVTLKVTNKTNGGWNSSSQRISVRNPGATAMVWVKIQQKTPENKIPLQSFYYSAEKESDKSNQPEWGLQVGGRNTFELKGRTIKSGTNNYIINDKFIPEIGTWYHIAGVIESGKQGTLYINSGYTWKGSASLTGPILFYRASIPTIDSTYYQADNHFSVTYPMTENEIKIICDSQKGTHSEPLS